MGPWTTMLSGAELDEAHAKVVTGIDVAGMGNLPAYVHGDATARLLGQQHVGLPDFAGFAAGLRIVDAHLAAMQVCIGRMYVDDPGYAEYYDGLAPGLTVWLREVGVTGGGPGVAAATVGAGAGAGQSTGTSVR